MKVEKLKKKELDEYCTSLGIDIKKKKKSELIDAVYAHEREKIDQAIKIQETLKTIYAGVDGEYYAGDEAWDYLEAVSGYDLKAILIEIADQRDHEVTND